MFSGASDDVKPIVGGFDVHPLSNRKTRRENVKNNRNRERTAKRESVDNLNSGLDASKAEMHCGKS